MEPLDHKSSLSNKPLAGMVVIMVVAMFAGGWLYVDSVKNELEAKINTVGAEAAAAQVQARNAVRKASAASVQESGTSTASDQEAPAP